MPYILILAGSIAAGYALGYLAGLILKVPT